MKIILSLLAVSSVMFAQSMNGQQYEDMIKSAHVQKTFEKVYYTEKKVEPKVEEVAVQEEVVTSKIEVVEGAGVPDDECAGANKEENSTIEATPATAESNASSENNASH